MKKWKKLLALIMCTAMICGLAACGGNESPEPESSAQPEEAVTGEEAADAETETENSGESFEGETVKIGFIGWGFTDTLGGEYKKYFEYISPEMGMEFNFVVALNQDEMVSQTESLIEEIGRASCRERVCLYV